MADNRSCPMNFPHLSHLEVVRHHPENGVGSYQPAMELAGNVAEERFGAYMPVALMVIP